MPRVVIRSGTTPFTNISDVRCVQEHPFSKSEVLDADYDGAVMVRKYAVETVMMMADSLCLVFISYN